MKLYFNENFELVKEEETDAFQGSQNFDVLSVYLKASKYDSLTSEGSVYPTYACKLPSGILTPEVSTWEIPTPRITVDQVAYVGWSCHLLRSVLEEDGSVQLTISFKIKNGTTLRVLKVNKSVLLVHEAINSYVNALFVGKNDASKILQSFKEIVDNVNEALANKMNNDGSLSADVVNLKELFVDYLAINPREAESGDYAGLYLEDNRLLCDILFPETLAYLSDITKALQDYVTSATYNAQISTIESDILGKASKNGSPTEDFTARRLTSSDASFTKGGVSTIDRDTHGSAALANIGYVDNAIAIASLNHIENVEWLEDKEKEGKYGIKITYHSVDGQVTKEPLIRYFDVNKVITGHSVVPNANGTGFILKLHFAVGGDEIIDLTNLTDTYLPKNVNEDGEQNDVIVEIVDGNISANLNPTIKDLVMNADVHEADRQTNEDVRKESEEDRKTAETDRRTTFDSLVSEINSKKLTINGDIASYRAEWDTLKSDVNRTMSDCEDATIRCNRAIGNTTEAIANCNNAIDNINATNTSINNAEDERVHAEDERVDYYNSVKNSIGSLNLLLEELLGGADNGTV